jgi:hypothetical protein
MKKNYLLTKAACLAVFALAVASPSMAQPLLNPGFESDAVGILTTGWLTNNTGNKITTAAYARTGTKSLLIDATGAGIWSSPNAYQQFPASAGEIFKLSGYMRRTNTLAGPNSFGLFKVEFRDGGGVILNPALITIGTAAGAPFYGGESTPVLNNASPINQWVFSQTEAVAPVNTASVYFYALNVNSSVNNNNIFFDDVSALKVTSSAVVATITSPINNGRRGPNFTISASGSVVPGFISSIAFYDGATLLGTDTTEPFSWDVTGASLGSHALKVVATASTGGMATSSVVNVTVSTAVTVKVDPSKNWVGYMNYFDTNSFYVGGSPWAVADLRASVSGNTLTLLPNTINDPASDWYVTTNSPSVGNRLMEANYYVEVPEFWPDQTVTFTGNVTGSSLLNLNNVNPNGQGWTAVAFIKDFASDYSSFDIQTVPLNNGTFSVSHTTGPDTLRHLQYGFLVFGPCVWAEDPVLASYGNIQIAQLTGPSITPVRNGGNLNLTFPTEVGCTYTVLCKTNLTDASWTSLAVTNGTGAGAVISTGTSGTSRFYRLSVGSN